MSSTWVLSRYPFHHDSFRSISKDQNRVPTGYLRGDACNCEPQAQRKRREPQLNDELNSQRANEMQRLF